MSTAFEDQLLNLRQQQDLLEQQMELHDGHHQRNLDAIAGQYSSYVGGTYIKKSGGDHRVSIKDHHDKLDLVHSDVDGNEDDDEDADGHDVRGEKQGNSRNKKLSRGELMQKYFDAMSEYPDYHARRQQALSNVQPFSFELRELRREKSTHARRAEEDAERRDYEVSAAMKAQFVSKPVPPSTFLHKYELMVEEWCARKEAIRLLSEERARALKAEQQQSADFAKEYGRGAEAVRGHRRSASAGGADAWRKQHPLFKATNIPADVLKPQWGEIQQKEKERFIRIKFRAEQLLKLAQAPRMQQVKENAGKQLVVASAAPGSKAPAASSTGKPGTTSLRDHNPNFTFKPKVDPTIPDFEYLWAKERVDLAQKKSSRSSTEPKPFRITDTKSSIAAIELDIKRDECTGVETRWPYVSTRTKVKPSKPIPVDPKRPFGTKAHAMMSEANYIRLAEAEQARAQQEKEDAALLKRQQAINERVMKYLPPQTHHLNLEKAAAEKREKARAETIEARKKLSEMKKKVQMMPPVFMEPTHLAEVAKARATTEQQVMKLLKEHGLSDQTSLSAIVAKPMVGDSAAAGASATTKAAQQPVEVINASDTATTSAGGVADPKSLVTNQTSAVTHVATTATTATASSPAAASKKRSNSSSSSSSSASSSGSD